LPIGPDGELVIAAEYEWTGDFASGLALFQSNGLCGYLNRNGEAVVEAQYQTAAGA
jgi:hypothetical protein